MQRGDGAEVTVNDLLISENLSTNEIITGTYLATGSNT